MESDPALRAGALRFGSVAELYDSVRPDYPERLIDAVLEYAGVAGGARALEIGAGTGQATSQFAWRGLAVDAIEPSAEMVELIQARFEGSGLAVSATAATLEAAELPSDTYELVYSATAWHWLEPGTRWDTVARVLAPGGALAVFYHVPLWRQTELRPQLDELYRASGAPTDKMGPLLELTPTLSGLAAEWLLDAEHPEEFGDTRAIGFSWADELPGQEYVQLLGTYGDHIALEPAVREKLFASIVELIDAQGGTIELKYSTFLLLARRQAK